MATNNPVVHFEMPYADAKRVAEFYKIAFGWKMDISGEAMGNYVIAETTETKEGRPTTPGNINGGFFQKTPDGPAQYPSVVIAVDDMEVAIKKVTEAGGKVLGEPMHIPGVGKYISFIDSEGNRVSILKPEM